MSNAPAHINARGCISEDDIVIAFMGPTGTGKSTFINSLTGGQSGGIGHGLISCTSAVKATRVQRSRYHGHIVLVDTPGFDDTCMSDLQVLQIIADWLKTTYKNKVKLTGLIYLHRITDNRLGGMPEKNLKTFRALCGNSAMQSVTLVTTMWDDLDSLETGEAREEELKNTIWKPMLNLTAGYERLADPVPERAWEIIDHVIQRKDGRKREAVLMQKEMVDFKLRLKETSAGRSLYKSLKPLHTEQRNTIREILEKIDASKGRVTAEEFEKDFFWKEERLRVISGQIKSLELNIFQRIKAYIIQERTKWSAGLVVSRELCNDNTCQIAVKTSAV